MEFVFDCPCGEEISEFTRGGKGEYDGMNLACQACEARYAVTITQLREGVRKKA